MKIASSSELLAAALLAVEDFEPQPNLVVRVRELSVRARKEFARIAAGDTDEALSVWLVINGCLDEEGNQLFSAESASQLQESSPKLIEAIGYKILELSGMRSTTDEEAGND